MRVLEVASLADNSEAASATALPPSPSFTPPATATPLPTSTPTPTMTESPVPTASASPTLTLTPTATPTPLHPLSIELMRRTEYPGSDLVIEQTLEPAENYSNYIVSYLSEGLKIYALMTVPWGIRPENGWPVIIFNHGYIEPDKYRSTVRYMDYVDYFARNGYIVFRSDYRGHGNSEGEPTGAYSNSNYTTDVLNGMASVQRYPEADPQRIGMWGHSMGGHITLRSMVVSEAIKAGVIWSGVLGDYPDLFARELTPKDPSHTPTPSSTRWPTRWRYELLDKMGTREENPEFWDSISANAYLEDISGPLQLHHATTDSTVPVASSQLLQRQMEAAGQYSELYLYEGDNHNIAVNFFTAMERSLAFFDEHVR